jgi:hypothetical protein
MVAGSRVADNGIFVFEDARRTICPSGSDNSLNSSRKLAASTVRIDPRRRGQQYPRGKTLDLAILVEGKHELAQNTSLPSCT